MAAVASRHGSASANDCKISSAFRIIDGWAGGQAKPRPFTQHCQEPGPREMQGRRSAASRGKPTHATAAAFLAWLDLSGLS